MFTDHLQSYSLEKDNSLLQGALWTVMAELKNLTGWGARWLFWRAQLRFYFGISVDDNTFVADETECKSRLKWLGGKWDMFSVRKWCNFRWKRWELTNAMRARRLPLSCYQKRTKHQSLQIGSVCSLRWRSSTVFQWNVDEEPGYVLSTWEKGQ